VTYTDFFEDFTLQRVEFEQATLRVRHGGSSSPVLLLHGHPRTHTTWHRLAPLLAQQHTVVCPDLRGYGESSKPPSDDRHTPYSKRAMAGDCVELMHALGHERFAVVGHDRGALVAFRTAMDHPGSVSALAVLDGLPIVEHLDRCDATFARAWWHWFFLGQSEKPAERVINADPDDWYKPDREQMGERNYADYRRAIHDPATVHAMCEDYRAGLGIDYEHDDADRRAARQVSCPTLVAWSIHDDMEDLYGEPLAIWRAWAPDVRAERIDSGHHIAEEAPERLASVLEAFLEEVTAATRW
jgi:haloacetate dehalogenase